MSVIDNVDNAILSLINTLVKEYESTGFLATASRERKGEIIKEIAELRASMTPQCDCKK